MAHVVGLTALQYIADELVDKVPAKAFKSDTYIPGKGGSDSRRGSKSQGDRRQSTSDDSKSRGPDEKSRDINDNDKRKDSKSEPKPRRTQSVRQPDRYPPRRSYDEPNPAYYAAAGAGLGAAGGAAYERGDFDRDAPREPTPPWESRSLTRSVADDGPRSRNRRESAPGTGMQGNQYYPPPPGPQGANNYHRYNPQDYQPQGYDPNYNGYGATVRFLPMYDD